MAPAVSLRGILTYASNLLSQIPLQLSGLPNPLSPIAAPRPIGGHDRPSAGFPNSSDTVTPYIPLTGAPTCPIDGPTSCQNTTAGDSCCFVHPGGRLLLTQFWDQEVHVGGSEEDWTLHGLWPDLCDGTYDQFCGMAPRFENITDILKHYAQDDLLEYMNRYWVAKYGGNAHLWAHEYNKHGTCINTLSPKCYDGYTPGLEVVDYFTRAFGLFKMLDTYLALSQAGIEPDYRKTFSLKKIQKTLEEFSGGKVVLKCTGRHHNVLHEAWYVYFVQGSLQSGEFVPARDSFKGDQTDCAAEVRYLPKRRKRNHS
ncbi:ribonuclease T2 family protein [Truncatella angustata]|uniref:ribonuclease T2 n=1 Tax=Truncatella angustata TaxID=152316 RepID=A0A9P8UHU4_9PEZI|nr:ribonuclease T2 family protein [Truncatella angustata]KAH6652354.1 ribonuclease T2 family protein [Truncatella angustata]